MLLLRNLQTIGQNDETIRAPSVAFQGLGFQKMHNAIQRIVGITIKWEAESVLSTFIHWIVIYRVDSIIYSLNK